ncbi:hypothetical protein [Piscirickettsia litoralis]|uniref:Uncharacterized protein n=1 Tax=Piscirickettsia litoralis TaxID=1891921 RepID=A0ABX3A675_9GAMM|nr:hypothetical protein [Piscirickettsia litoralis]ODN41609.1 hypothetical protein BGC07_16060 [Piscirickettsia litoralis]
MQGFRELNAIFSEYYDFSYAENNISHLEQDVIDTLLDANNKGLIRQYLKLNDDNSTLSEDDQSRVNDFFVKIACEPEFFCGIPRVL